MKAWYPTPAYLSAILGTLICAERHESDHAPIELEALDIVEQWKLLRDLPLYCEKVSLRAAQDHPECKDIIRGFRMGKSKQDLKAMETVVKIILDSSSYKKARPFSEKKLANVLSEFLWHFKERLDFQMWKLLDQTFEMHFFVHEKDIHFVKNHIGSFVDRLAKGDGLIPFFPLDKTRLFIRNKLLASSHLQQGTVTLRREILEDHLRQEFQLVHDEYIPFVESLFEIWKEKLLPITSVSSKMVQFTSLVVAEKQGIAFDEKESMLRIREKIVKITKHKSQWNLLRVLCKDRESQEKDWQFSELKNAIDPLQKKKDIYNAAFQLRQRLEGKGVENFLFTTTHSVQINPRYLEES